MHIHIVEAEANRRGDLFCRLAADLFRVLGYGPCRHGVHKSGRELDLQAPHRTEQRRAVAECKARREAVGGRDLNTFAGVLDAERRASPDVDVAGYFVSLSGYTGTAEQQETDVGGRFRLLDGDDMVRELVEGRVLADPVAAAARAGELAVCAEADASPDPELDLLVHELGRVWAVFFRRGGERTHVALVHADGELLAPALVARLREADEAYEDVLGRVAVLKAEPTGPAPEELEAARRAYLERVVGECGHIDLHGLPADGELGVRRFELERLFVPLAFVRDGVGVQVALDDAFGDGHEVVDIGPSAMRVRSLVPFTVGQRVAVRVPLEKGADQPVTALDVVL